MKKIILLIFLLSSLFSSAQVRVSLKLKNNLEIKDSIKQIGEILISLKTDKKYKLNDVSEIKIYEKKKSKHYYILDVKSHKRSKQVQKGLGTKVFSNRNIELYFIYFGFNIKNINYQIMFDRIEAGTYMVAAALTEGSLKIINIKPDIIQTEIKI